MPASYGNGGDAVWRDGDAECILPHQHKEPALTRILIFGGTFDPPHRAHTELPPLVAAKLGCDRILYVPAAINPLKIDAPPADAKHRLAMLRLALQDMPAAEVSTIELERPGPSYTIDTLEDLRRQYGSAIEFRLLIGADQALEFDRWKDWRRIIKIAPPAVMLRPPWSEDGGRTFLRALSDRLGEGEAANWEGWLVETPSIEVSATELRRRLREKQDVRGMLAPEVAAYIDAHGLYLG